MVEHIPNFWRSARGIEVRIGRDAPLHSFMRVDLFLQLHLEFSLPWDQPDTRDACEANQCAGVSDYIQFFMNKI
jgi:hypothetical protein